MYEIHASMKQRGMAVATAGCDSLQMIQNLDKVFSYLLDRREGETKNDTNNSLEKRT